MPKNHDIFLREHNARDIAVNALLRFERTADFIQDSLHRSFEQRQFSPRDKRLATELACGACRHLITLDFLIERNSNRPLRRIDPIILSILRVGLYQLVYLTGTPDYAALDQAVEQAKKSEITGSDGFVNAILRAVQSDILDKISLTEPIEPTQSFDCHAAQPTIADRRAVLPIDPDNICRFKSPFLPDPAKKTAKYLTTAYAHPPWLIDRWLKFFNAKTLEQICAADNARPMLTLRPNPLRHGDTELPKLLQTNNINFVRSGHAITLLDPINPDQLPGYPQGLFSVQDATAMKVAPLINPKSGQKILDLCAAPGGKTTHLAELMNNTGQIIACDINSDGLSLINDNCHRLGISIVKTCHASELNNILVTQGPFDAVLVDAPCSNTGVLARRVEVRHRLKTADLQQLAKIQLEILQSAARAVQPKGLLVYSTCSIDPAENETLIKKFLADNTDFELIEQYLTFPAVRHPIPNLTDQPEPIWQDGGFAAQLIRKN